MFHQSFVSYLCVLTLLFEFISQCIYLRHTNFSRESSVWLSSVDHGSVSQGPASVHTSEFPQDFFSTPSSKQILVLKSRLLRKHIFSFARMNVVGTSVQLLTWLVKAFCWVYFGLFCLPSRSGCWHSKFECPL